MKSKILFIGIVVALMSATLGTVGFSVLELEQRSAAVSVAAEDTNGLLALQPGASSAVTINSDGVLEINLTEQFGANEGMNPDARLTIGDSADGAPEAFSATNTYNQDIQVQVTAENVQRPQTGNSPVGSITLYQNGTGTELSAGDPSSVTLTPGSSASYSLEFDTPAGIDTPDAFQADLTFEVTEA